MSITSHNTIKNHLDNCGGGVVAPTAYATANGVVQSARQVFDAVRASTDSAYLTAFACAVSSEYRKRGDTSRAQAIEQLIAQGMP